MLGQRTERPQTSWQPVIDFADPARPALIQTNLR